MQKKSKSAAKTAPRAAPSNIDEYIALFPDSVQQTLSKLREIVHEEAPDAEEAIKYQIPTFVLHGNLIHFAAFKNHVGVYPTASGIEKFKDQLAKYVSAKGSVQFPFDKPFPFPLFRKMVKFRVKENLEKSKKRK